MDKLYITANELLLDSFKLAEQIFQRGYRPHFIVGVWRGGSPVGNFAWTTFSLPGRGRCFHVLP